MIRNRFVITLQLTVDQDGVPGWGNTPEDFIKLTKEGLERVIPHYNPSIETMGFTERDKTEQEQTARQERTAKRMKEQDERFANSINLGQ